MTFLREFLTQNPINILNQALYSTDIGYMTFFKVLNASYNFWKGVLNRLKS